MVRIAKVVVAVVVVAELALCLDGLYVCGSQSQSNSTRRPRGQLASFVLGDRLILTRA